MPEDSSQTSSILKRMTDNIKVCEQLAHYFTINRKTAVSTEEIRLALFERWLENKDLKTVIDLSSITLEYVECKALLENFNFDQFKISILIEETLLPEGVIPDRYASIKHDGRVWRIHLNDADPWPSIPHAHVVNTPYVIDLSNGNIYEKRNFKQKLDYKSLLAIRTKFEQLPAFKGKMPTLTV
jgi:hypothetical protein